NAKLRKQTTVDPLTGYGNRQYRVRRTDDALRQARQRGGAICLLMIRLDGFAELEKHHGKTLMQQLVLAFSWRLRQLVRPLDVLARVSPDHFCLIAWLPDANHATPSSFRRLYDGLNHRAYK